MKILIVEDDIKISAFLEKGLIEESYIVDCCFDGEEAFYLITTNKYDLIVLDLMIPYLDGIQLCKDLRAMGNNIPIIMLSAKSDIEDKVLGLNSGANDYLAKPFSFDELIARIKVQLRDNDTCINTLMIDDLKLDCDRKQVIRGDNMIFLTQKEYMLLEYLLRHRGKILSKEILSEALWNMNDEIESNVLNVHIYQLRQKIDTKNKTKLIHTIRGMGYKIDV